MVEKRKHYLRPSSLGSYFGVGFNDPDTQYKLDTGQLTEEFDEESRDRLNVGIQFEEASLNYFEDKLMCIINRRNDTVFDFYGGKLRGKVDGMTYINGEETVVENKISSSSYEKFVDKLGYHIQVHCYMMATDTKQALLCGFQQGKPIYKLVYRDEKIIADIKRMVDFVVDAMDGNQPWENFSLVVGDIVEKYSNKPVLAKVDTMSEETQDKFIKLQNLRKEKSVIEEQIQELNDELIGLYDSGVFENDKLRVIITKSDGRISYDVANLSLDHPEIDLSKYTRKSAQYKQIRVTKRGR